MGKALGIDYGEKYIGIAISDEEKKIAFPRTVLSAKDTKLMDTLRSLCREEGIERIVLGLPLDLEDRERRVSQKTQAFGKELEEMLHLPVEFIDESFSTQEAREKMGKFTEESEKDLVASQIILQRYLETRNKS